MKVLIIDDHKDSAEALARLIEVSWKMEDVELRIVCVETMEDGLRESPDANVTILDLGLPDSTPEESIGKIHLFQPPVIVMTGFDDDQLTARAMAAGAAHVYIKGSLLGFVPKFFSALQQDVIRRANTRNAKE